MAKQDNFDFETEDKGKFKLDLSFLKNLTKQQKGIILAAVVGVVVVIAVILTCIMLVPTFNKGNGDGGNSNSTVPDTVKSMNISSYPTKTTYYVGEQPDYSGLTVFLGGEEMKDVYIKYDREPNSFSITGFDSSTPVESQTITVTCGGKSATFTVKIIPIPEEAPKLLSIELVPPTKTEYKLYEPLSLKGGSIKCTYDNGDVIETPILLDYISGHEAMENGVGEYVIKVTYRDGPVSLEDSFTITVTE